MGKWFLNKSRGTNRNRNSNRQSLAIQSQDPGYHFFPQTLKEELTLHHPSTLQQGQSQEPALCSERPAFPSFLDECDGALPHPPRPDHLYQSQSSQMPAPENLVFLYLEDFQLLVLVRRVTWRAAIFHGQRSPPQLTLNFEKGKEAIFLALLYHSLLNLPVKMSY